MIGTVSKRAIDLVSSNRERVKASKGELGTDEVKFAGEEEGAREREREDQNRCSEE
jgi:hypothetical protein